MLQGAHAPCNCCVEYSVPTAKGMKKTCYLQERAITLLRDLEEASIPTAVGDIKNVGKTEKIGSALRKGSGQYKKKKKGVWLLRRKIGFGEEQQWVSEVEAEIKVSGLPLKLQGSKEH